ncbi:Phosphomevalonate kinase [Martensiomyces pterosporus]|nr:Phosphomevalonate kinase [Martensiomyces pterosporus]
MTQTSTSSPATLASAPGKVLVVGGYLVLDRSYSGLVVGTDTCLYAAVHTQVLDTASAPTLRASDIPVLVVSPQFNSAWWKYVFSTESSTLVQYESADGGSNAFVEVVLEAALGLANDYARSRVAEMAAAEPELPPANRKGLKIALMADNDFYSQRRTLKEMGLDLSSESLQKLPRMCATGTTLKDVHKTGLGSSAAMVTSLVAAILAHFGAVNAADLQAGKAVSAESERSLKLVHNIAQYAHCLAQGKIGSGFDVSSAVYGSHVYRRFSPAVLEAAMAQRGDIKEVKRATSPDNDGWNSDVTPVHVPPRFILRLADVDGGSNTPSMAKKVLGWQKANPEAAKELWSSLDAANRRICAVWGCLAAAHVSNSSDYDSAIDWCSAHRSTEWTNAPNYASSATHQLLADLVAATQDVRSLQRTLGESAEVPIEPPKQTRLLDACMDVPGVCMAAVPGAGGYDAIFCVTLGQDASRAVEQVWSQWTEMSVGPLLANQASSGVRILDPAAYPEITSRL